ncbi:ATP-binding protein [Reichenbachiella carrageenanivorans]|uniref:histidine kinase n=1 Tax=Reichenbachiella carrageenanivorans TaxID=2979869 RepID=A0ABY6CWY5_9BACT|nr:sensor histidine kinase [Reichenbachiella carrageenanivorans]UXX78427.1 ATP-binding protein [Reichenbachiella carrageenanivorans]
MRSYFVLLFLGLCFAYPGIGQSSFDPQLPIDHISLSQWTAEDGLSSNNLTSVFQDSRGLLWVTSFNGVMIYDGERIEVYDINNLSLLETDGFYTVVEGADGIIYLGSQGSGVLKYTGGQFSKLKPTQGVLPKSIPSLLMSTSGVLYIGSNNNGLYKFENGEATRIDFSMLNNSTISDIEEDEKGRIWVSTEGQGIFCINNAQVEKHYLSRDGLLDDYIEDLAITSVGVVLIASSQGLQLIDSKEEIHAVEAFSGVYVNHLMIDDWGAVWAGTEDGLARWVQGSGRVDWIYGKGGIDLVRISAIIKDEENSLWLTSSRTGLIRVKESKLTNYTYPSLSSNRVNIIHESWDGRFYIGTDQNQIDIYDEGKYARLKINTDLNGNGIRDIYHDRDGSFWLATYIGIVHKEGEKETVYSTYSGMPANNFRTVLKDSRGDFWFGSRSGGLVQFRNDEIVEIYNHENKLESNFVLSVTESENGDLLIGTHSGGMTIIRSSGSSTTLHLKPDDSGVLLFNIDMISDTTAWVTANIGLVYYNGDSLMPVDLMSDKRSKTYFDLVDDGKDDLWLTTNLGIIQIAKKNWQKYQNGEVTELSYQLLDENNGMNNKECTGATRSLLTKDGKVMVPTLGGVCEVNPSKLQYYGGQPKVTIRNVEVDNERLSLQEEVAIIEPGALRYVFEFAVHSYTASDRNQYKYLLEGLENEWSAPSYNGRVEYTSLPPGKYTFRVIGANENNIWNNIGAEFSFRVKPYFYQTAWFYLLIFLLVMGTFILIYQWRMAFINRQNVELKKVNAELDRFVYSASHEIRSPLSSILGLINLARMGDPHKRLEYFDHIEKSVNRLDDFIHDIVDYSRNARLGIEVSLVDFNEIISDIIADISHTANFEKIRYEMLLNHKEDFYTDVRRLKVVLSNVIINAFKHHQPDRISAPFVLIEIADTKKGVKITVSDNGPGIEKKHHSKMFNMFYRATTSSEGSGLGLYIVSEILEKLQGEIEVTSEQGVGTTFDITLRNMEALFQDKHMA